MLTQTTLHPRLSDPAVLDVLRAEWAKTRRLRIENALRPGLAETLADAALRGPFSFFEKHLNDIQCVFWRRAITLDYQEETSADAPFAEAHLLFARDLPALATAITRQALHRAGGDHEVVFDLYRKGSYLDVHTDQGADRLVAYVVGLTRQRWPAAQGGHLEFLAADEQTVLDRVPPGFGSVDLFCIFPLLRPHRVPILRANVTRLSVNGWLTGEIKAPGED